MASYLVVIYGTSSARKETAWQLARALPGKSAVLSLDNLTDGAIARPDDDASAELDMAHIQLRLLVANYMRNGYHVVVEGAFYHVRDGKTHAYDHDIDQLVALMRNMTRRALTVHLQATGNDSSGYRRRYGNNALTLDSANDVSAAVEAITQRLLAEGFT